MAGELSSRRGGRDVGYAQTIYLLPVSLFGMAVSAAELPEMSRAVGSEEEIAAQLRARIGTGLRQIAYFVIPSAMAFLAFGDVIAALLFQNGGLFTRDGVAVRVGNSRRLGRRAARVDARSPLLVDVLRAARHAHAAAVSRSCASCSPRSLGYAVRVRGCRGCSESTSIGAPRV